MKNAVLYHVFKDLEEYRRKVKVNLRVQRAQLMLIKPGEGKVTGVLFHLSRRIQMFFAHVGQNKS